MFKDNGQKLKANTVFLYTKNSDNTKAIKDKVKKLGYSGSMQETMTDMFTQMLDVITYVLAAIAGVSLVVSAIMILVVLNISVVERTKEIGVLKALGARRKDVRRIFVSEAFLIGLGSGLLGVVITEILGFAINSVTKPAYDVNVVSLEPQFLISGIIISIVISIKFFSFINPDITNQIRMCIHYTFIQYSDYNRRIALTFLPGFRTTDITPCFRTIT